MIGTKWYELVQEIGIFGELPFVFHARVAEVGSVRCVFACSYVQLLEARWHNLRVLCTLPCHGLLLVVVIQCRCR
jgi:hypothetical protein